jgi:hypothetical protein
MTRDLLWASVRSEPGEVGRQQKNILLSAGFLAK